MITIRELGQDGTLTEVTLAPVCVTRDERADMYAALFGADD